ncbi:MAG: RIP metalloprotease RseP [Actinomycetota bacterium]|nr:RIP metalloprotease RseP [Actinomycetota bacterium]
MTVIVAILGLIALIIIHELGHMLTAKALGVHVPEFGVGFGPALFKKKVGKTVYSFRIILLGGFARMKGMEGIASMKEVTGERGADSYLGKAAWRRALIIFAGPFANLLVAVAIFAGIFMVGVPTGVEPEVEQVVPGSLAAEMGLEQGDKILSVDGVAVEEWEDFQGTVVEKSPGDEVTLVAEQNGEREEYSGALTADPEDPEKAIVGVQPVLVYTSYGPLEALWEGTKRTFEVIGLFGWFVGQLVTGQTSFYENAAGPVGIVNVSSVIASEEGAFVFAQLLAFISLNLAVFNLIPLLPLDGGHLFFIAAEKVLGRPVSPETVARVAAFGLALILMLFVFATYADLSKIFTGQPLIPEQGP